MKFYTISLISLCFAACQADRAFDVDPKLDELDVVTEVPNPPSIATTHQGDWPLIAGENPRLFRRNGDWRMRPPDCHHRDIQHISTLVMNYSDFTAGYTSENLIDLVGPYQWAWSDKPFNEPNSFDGDNDIKIIVYRNILPEEELYKEFWPGSSEYAIALDDVKKLYVTDKDKQLDFRYLAYTDALSYLNELAGIVYREDLALMTIGRKFEIKGMFCKIPR